MRRGHCDESKRQKIQQFIKNKINFYWPKWMNRKQERTDEPTAKTTQISCIRMRLLFTVVCLIHLKIDLRASFPGRDADLFSFYTCKLRQNKPTTDICSAPFQALSSAFNIVHFQPWLKSVGPIETFLASVPFKIHLYRVQWWSKICCWSPQLLKHYTHISFAQVLC